MAPIRRTPPVLFQEVHAGDAIEVDEDLRVGQPESHHRDQALPASQETGIRAVLLEEADSLIQGRGGGIFKWRGKHGGLLIMG